MAEDKSYLVAWRLLLLAILCALIGAGLFFYPRATNALALTALCIGLLSLAACLVRLFRAISEDPSLTPEQARSLRAKLLLLGPLGALDILVSRRQK